MNLSNCVASLLPKVSCSLFIYGLMPFDYKFFHQFGYEMCLPCTLLYSKVTTFFENFIGVKKVTTFTSQVNKPVPIQIILQKFL